MFSGIAGDSTQQVVLCFDWCALGWMFYPSACTFSVAGSNWKAVCVERRPYRLEGGKGREVLPILTLCENRNHSVESCKSGKNGMTRKGVLECRKQFDALFA